MGIWRSLQVLPTGWVLGTVLFACLGANGASASESHPKLREIAREALNQNVVKLPSGLYLRAGAHQFASLWTRDFAYSVPGMLADGKAETVRSHLTALLAQRRADDGLIPRSLSSFSTQGNVVKYTLSRIFGLPADYVLQDPLAPEYIGEHDTISFDSNILVVLASLQYLDATRDESWWQAHREELKSVFRFYDAYLKDGLLSQPEFSDWQDSVKRDGATFLTHFLYWKVGRKLLGRLPGLEISQVRLDDLRARIDAVFFDPATGLYKSSERYSNISLDGNLFALMEPGFWRDPADRTALYERLKRHPLWTSRKVPGISAYPDYPSDDTSFFTSLVGLKHYHDSMSWSWLISASARAALAMGDRPTADAILGELERMAERFGGIHEIYELDSSGDLVPFNSLFYGSESPFSWGAADVLDTLALFDH